MSLSRRTLAAARRRMREDPGSVAEVVFALVLVLSEVEDGDEGALSAEQAVALTWWWCACGEADA